MIYVAVLIGIFLASAWLEFVVRTRVFRRWKRLLVALGGTIPLLVLWDWYAISERHWRADRDPPR